MKNHKKIGVVGILWHKEVEKIASEFRKVNVPLKPKKIDEIVKEEESIKITIKFQRKPTHFSRGRMSECHIEQILMI